ncbi:UDP-N-acetylglucosamine 2-epimerase (hydrolyzing) [Salmonella enterica]|nr:UDP-N-acetylglucosamine 2-epimerase (hydrolyzing) [Salmonella enterica]EGJ3417098.1 UDP-N-acetylglucosamine 2-epimerase (hydrolyzing) [Salmonella enterica subsp. houtenae]
MKKILYVTGSRAEYGIVKRLLLKLNDDPDLNLSIVATGMHCDNIYGNTIHIIEEDGLTIDAAIDIKINTTSNAHILKSMAICLESFGEYFEKNNYDAVMVLGDRYEIFSVAIAAAMHNIPLIHIHGGEKTLANYDEFIRHAITKMSKLHLTSTEEYRNRVIQLGENPDFVFNIGSLGAENASSLRLPLLHEMEEKHGAFTKPYYVVLFHPETLATHSVEEQVDQLLTAIESFKDIYDFIFIGSNSDTGSNIIREKIGSFCYENKFRNLVSLRTEEYLALNKYSCGLIGNSSSGLIEIPSLKIPTINIGDRQKGRVRGKSVIDVPINSQDIIKAIKLTYDSSFLDELKHFHNPYVKEKSLDTCISLIKQFLQTTQHDYKDFYDLPLLTSFEN